MRQILHIQVLNRYPVPQVTTSAAEKNWIFWLTLVVPTMLILLWVVMPLIQGDHTLYLRDVLNAHLEKKFVQAEAMASGYLPLLDPYRDGGQPLVGNPNAVALYPDNILLLVASPLWVLNSHFWLHLLLAPFTAFWLARAWGLRRQAAWAAGVLFVSSGFVLSMLNLYNMVAGVVLTPALIAAMMELSAGSRRASRLFAVAIVWCLLLLAGDPMIAAMALVLALSASMTKWGWRGVSWKWSLTGVGIGIALALPQLVEFARILPMTYRGYWGFSPSAATTGSWHPFTALELLLPFAFGKPDLTFWGRQFYGGTQPLILTLYPGVVALWLLACSGKPRSRIAWWSWGVIGVGVFMALGSFNPLVGLLWQLPGASLLRLPIKFWLLVVLGASLLGAVGFQRLLEGERKGFSAARILALFGLGFLLAWLLLSFLGSPVNEALRTLVPAEYPDEMVHHERLRWAGASFLSVAALGLIAVLLRLGRRWPAVIGGGVLVTHLVFQVVVLRPAIAIDEVAPYVEPSPLLELVPEGAMVVYGKDRKTFGAPNLPLSEYPDYRALWLQRQVYRELYPAAGIQTGRRYAFNVSPEGLDSFLTRVTVQALGTLTDLGRVRVLAASGVEYLLLDRSLAEDAAREAELVGSSPTLGGEILVYRILRPAAAVQMVGGVRRAPHLNAAIAWMVADDFDPRAETVLPEGGEPLSGPPGAVEVISSSPEELIVAVDSSEPGVLLVQRAFLPLYKATIDGARAPLVAANVHRLGLDMPAGEHSVRIWVDRNPFRISGGIALLSLVLLCGLSWRLRQDAEEKSV